VLRLPEAVAHPEPNVVSRILSARILVAQQDAENREQRQEPESDRDHRNTSAAVVAVDAKVRRFVRWSTTIEQFT